jgi:predicted transposase YbfD/YdcC
METAGRLRLADVFVSIQDPGQSAKVKHDLVELLVVAVNAVLVGADTFAEIELWAEEKLEWLRGYLRLEHGIPSHDTFGRIFGLIDPEQFESAFRLWVSSILPALGTEIVAIDGKTSRRSGGVDATALHLVSAFAAGAGLVLGQRATAEKSNEITAIPELLSTLALTGCTVTIDAMGIQTVAGVSSASAQTGTPFFPPRMTPFAVGEKFAPGGGSSKWPTAGFRAITPDFFKTFGIQMMEGRAFTEQDSPSSVKVAIVNAEFVRRFLNGIDPLRAHVWLQQSVEDERTPATPTEWQIVGVSHDTLSKSMRDHVAEIYIPFWQRPSSAQIIAVRTAVDPDSMIKSIGAAVQSIDSSAILARPRTMEEIRNQVLASDRFPIVLFVSFGTIALLLATLGVYGVVSFSVARRRSEIAVRMALGANRINVVALVVRQGLSLAVAGLSLGLGGAYLLNQGMRSALLGIGRIDFAVLGGVALLFLIAALLACVAPAGCAASVEPMQALRME